MTGLPASLSSMDTADETPGIGNRILRVLLRIFLVLCGIGLFMAAGMTGGLLTLNWLI